MPAMQMVADPTLSGHERLVASLEATTVNGGFRLSRSFAKVLIDLKPFMAENRTVGAEELDEMTRKRKEAMAKHLAKARAPKAGLFNLDRAKSLRFAPGGTEHHHGGHGNEGDGGGGDDDRDPFHDPAGSIDSGLPPRDGSAFRCATSLAGCPHMPRCSKR